MSEFDFINTFFNIVYQNESAYMRDFTSSYDYFNGFRDWLKSRCIDVGCLAFIHKQNYKFIQKKFKSSDVDHILHIPFSTYLEHLSMQFKEKTHVLYIPGFNQNEIFDIDLQVYHDIYFYSIKESFQRSDLSFYDPFPAFFIAMNHADLWPGILVFNQHKQVFKPMTSKQEFEEVIEHIDESLFETYSDYENDAYMIQLSDLHLGKNRRTTGLAHLYTSLDSIVPHLHSHYQLKIVITGDLMESPNRRNMYLANDVMNSLKKIYKANVTFILGNHDMIVHGLNMARNQKSKVIAYLLGESIKVFEKDKVILIKMDTCSHGNLARGMVGQRQLDEIDDELETIDDLNEYTLIALVHHHIYPLSKAQFIKTKWHEKTFINRIVETSKVLVDAPLLIDWFQKRNVHYVMHGHKHLPFFRYKDGIYYIGAGSATGGLKESQSRYISYNVVKYNTLEKKMKTCMIFYDDKAKAERQRVEVYLFKEEDNEDCR